MKIELVCLLTSIVFVGPTFAGTAVINVAAEHGMTLNGIASAIAEAKHHFLAVPDDTVILQLPSGKYDLSTQYKPDMIASIDVSGVRPGSWGRLVVKGGLQGTVLVFANRGSEIYGKNASRVTFDNLVFTVDAVTVTQGHVVSLVGDQLTLDISPGFPSPLALYDPIFSMTHKGTGRAVRRYTNSKTDPQLDPDPANVQFSWDRPVAVPGFASRWTLMLNVGRRSVPYRPGDLICIKAKTGANGFAFSGGSDISFVNDTWIGVTHGILRDGAGNGAVFVNDRIARGPAIQGQVPCLASAAGGPQIGFPTDPPIRNVTIENFTSDASGDNALGLFNVAQGSIRNSTFKDAFTPPVLLFKSPEVDISRGNTFLRGAIMKRDRLRFW